MILHALNDLYTRLSSDPDYDIAPRGYSPQNITFRVVLKPDGSLFAIQDARTKDAKGKLRSTRKVVIGEAKPPGAGLNPCFLWDNTGYLLGYKTDDTKPERTAQSFSAFRDKHLALEKEINLPEFSTVCRFLENWSPDQAQKYAEENPLLNELATGFGLFEIQGQTKPVNEHPEILNWWNNQQNSPSPDSLGQCLVTGQENTPIARLHPKIKSIAGAQSAGASLVSFNAPAYESYLKDQSYNSPVSEEVSFQYGTALNALLSGRQSHKHRLRIGDTTCVYWTDQKSDFEDIFGLISSEGSHAGEKAQDEGLRLKIENTLSAIQKGRDAYHNLNEDPEKTLFYILGLAPNAARLSVRFFHQSTLADLLDHLHAHQRDLSIVREWETPKGKRLADPEFPANWQLLTQSARVSDEIPPLLSGSLMRAILQNTPYPESLYSAVIRRIRADREINYLRAAIIKGTLTRNHKLTLSIMLDHQNTDPAYLLGRLFATLEKTQQDALGDLNSGLRDKFYSSASATPASVFPRILRTYQHHLAKLNPGAKVIREKLIQEILLHIPATGFPHHFNLKSQGIFALGYYHQRKDFFTKKDTPETIESNN